MRKVVRTGVVLAVAGGLLVAGCGGAVPNNSATPNNAVTNSTAQAAPINALPSGVEQHLSSYSSRIQKVDKLPVQVPSSVDRVLLISPLTEYAISQFQEIWPKLNPKPAVVWVGMPEAQTKQMWSKLGYHGDPLPSPVTLYDKASVPVPAAYRKVSGGWEEVPGVLKSSEVNQWVNFFSKN
ncbi:hypothetical protein [Alicyclobacillus macrosporangiidus]|uniref:hypothetical protein n=1 Tax=Alicyclobacillus macrosporangiidus TaxID=392015 RepID=UPI000943AFFB|nr:hypothetical protein [Alicyclobacillus macrosporangiidus]